MKGGAKMRLTKMKRKLSVLKRKIKTSARRIQHINIIILMLERFYWVPLNKIHFADPKYGNTNMKSTKVVDF